MFTKSQDAICNSRNNKNKDSRDVKVSLSTVVSQYCQMDSLLHFYVFNDGKTVTTEGLNQIKLLL